MNMCLDARRRCSDLFAAAHDGNVVMIRAATLSGLRDDKPPCCFDKARVEHMACMGGSYDVFCELVKKGLRVNAMERVSVQLGRWENLHDIAKRSGCAPLVALLKRGELSVPPPWSTIRLFFIGRLDSGCVFYGAPKDVARLLAQALTEVIPFLDG
jgi:ankyrin repeat protein